MIVSAFGLAVAKTPSVVSKAETRLASFRCSFIKDSIDLNSVFISSTGNSNGSVGVSEVCHGVTPSLPISNAFKRGLHIGQICFNRVPHSGSHSAIKRVSGFAMWASVATRLKLSYGRLADLVAGRASEVNFSSLNVHFMASRGSS